MVAFGKKLEKFMLRAGQPHVFYNTMLSAYAQKFKPEKTNAHLVSAQIELTLRCNLFCPMCESPLIRETTGDMTFEHFKKIVDECPGLISLNLTGIGEGMLVKEFPEMLKYAKSKGIYTWFTTNGTLLYEKFTKQFFEIGVDEVVISFDGSNKETFDAVRLGASFEDVVKKLKDFAALKKQMGAKKPKLTFGTTLVWENIRQLPDIVRLAGEIGIEEVIIGAGLVMLDKPEAVINAATPKMSKPEMYALFEEAKRIGAEKGMKVSVEIPPTAHGEECDCVKPWTTCYITKDGYFFPCCEITQRRIPRAQLVKHAFGNVFTQNVGEIINSLAYQKLRKGIKDPNERWILCKGCDRCRKPEEIAAKPPAIPIKVEMEAVPEQMQQASGAEPSQAAESSEQSPSQSADAAGVEPSQAAEEKTQLPSEQSDEPAAS